MRRLAGPCQAIRQLSYRRYRTVGPGVAALEVAGWHTGGCIQLVRGCIALAVTARVPADQSSPRLADPVKGGELSYMVLAMEREQTRSIMLLMVAGVVLADPEPMPSRLIRGRIALAFTACIPARNHRLADTVKRGELSYTTLGMDREHIACSSLLRRAGAVLADPEPMTPSSDTWLHRPGLHMLA